MLTEDKSKVQILDTATNSMLHPGFDVDELTNLCDQESKTFHYFNFVAHKS